MDGASAMPTPAENIRIAIEQVTQRIVEVTSSYKPTYTVDGESYSHETYLTALQQNLLALQQAQQTLQGPFQKMTRIKT
jgi:hypothetical protein